MSQSAPAASEGIYPSNPHPGVIPDQPPSSSSSGAEPAEPDSSTVDCAICLEPCVFPVELTCGHSFCYLCVKGTAVQATQYGQKPRCSICRREIAANIISNPQLKDCSGLHNNTSSDEHQWYYECRSGGWWQFEERFSKDLQTAFDANQLTCQLLIAGQMYEVDFVRMVQYRPNNRNIVRRIKRDLANTPKKGIAGIRIACDTGTRDTQSQGGVQLSAIPSALVNPSRLTGARNHVYQHNRNNEQEPSEDLFGLHWRFAASLQEGNYNYEEDDDDENDDDDDEEDENIDFDEDEEDYDEVDGIVPHVTEAGSVDSSPREGARAPTSRSDRSTASSLANHTPPLPIWFAPVSSTATQPHNMNTFPCPTCSRLSGILNGQAPSPLPVNDQSRVTPDSGGPATSTPNHNNVPH